MHGAHWQHRVAQSMQTFLQLRSVRPHDCADVSWPVLCSGSGHVHQSFFEELAAHIDVSMVLRGGIASVLTPFRSCSKDRHASPYFVKYGQSVSPLLALRRRAFCSDHFSRPLASVFRADVGSITSRSLVPCLTKLCPFTLARLGVVAGGVNAPGGAGSDTRTSVRPVASILYVARPTETTRSPGGKATAL